MKMHTNLSIYTFGKVLDNIEAIKCTTFFDIFILSTQRAFQSVFNNIIQNVNCVKMSGLG